LTQWDIKPPGYENVTAEQAKMSGMFPLPGAPRQQAMDPSKLQAFINQPQGGAATNAALKPSTARQSKRLFMYNIAPNTTEADIVDFFNLQMNGLNVVTNPDPCISANLPNDKQFALVEFKSATEATVALALDGITMPQHLASVNGNGEAPSGLDIKRPKDYIVPAAEDDEYAPGDVSSVVPDSANKVCVSNIPAYLTEEQITELLSSFGDLRAFTLVKDNGTGESRGIAFCEYKDPSSTNIAIEGLNGMELGDAKLKITRASIGFTQASGLEMGVSAMSMFAGTQSTELAGGRVLQLLNMVTPEELIDNDDYEGLSFPLSPADHPLTSIQISARTSKKSAPSTAPSWRSRSHVPRAAADNLLVWARFTSSMRTLRVPRRPLRSWRAGSLQIGQW
jgi:splicing factor U2AF 65 kDa subunit